VWSAVYLPFGGVHVTTGAPIDARFPGQWFQTEAGLYQNWMRDYDPTTGRYIEADPLGLVDGASVYGYAGQNPGRYTDPTGEFIPAIIAGALIGAAVDFGLQYWAQDGRLECINYWQVGLSGILGASTGGAGGAAGKEGLVAFLRGLSNSTKGRIGEALTRASTPHLWWAGTASRQRVIGNGLRSRADFTFGRGGFTYYIESKFGTSTLTKAQRVAQKALGSRYIVDRWGYDYFGRAGGYLGGTAGVGLGLPFFPNFPNESGPGACNPCGD
jgi:RHS repeat-associated protein